ncbi:Clp protease N-terminal domain-containing protein [Nonomuraea sp. NPDC046802]|uniref:Clp protease N-terminal domain-containing protein n=1 Tax=Nonomuraea sp. NPDC046802 TaxID=3154919 RepID=UPI0033D94A99
MDGHESLQRSLDDIGTEHLLLALVHDGASTAAQVLVKGHRRTRSAARGQIGARKRSEVRRCGAAAVTLVDDTPG